MEKLRQNEDIDPKDLPQSEVYKKKEVFQERQPADWGKPMPPVEDEKATSNHKEEDKTSKEEGLNEQHSDATAGAFEGFEDQDGDR